MKKTILRPLFAALVVAALQTAVLGYMIESRASILRNGAEVLLKTAPVDPRDLLRGDYVVLSYDISTIPVALVTGEKPQSSGQTRLSVRLEKRIDGFWGVTEASFAPLGARAGSVVAETLPFTYYPDFNDASGSFFVSYGIERFYVPEGEGKVLEEARNSEALSVAVRVSSSGAMQIREIALHGTPVYGEPLY